MSLKQKATYEKFDDLQGAKIYMKALPEIFYIKWIIRENGGELILAYNKGKDKMFQLTDFLLFLEELERNNMIRVINIGERMTNKWFELYDKNQYVTYSDLPENFKKLVVHQGKSQEDPILCQYNKNKKSYMLLNTITETNRLGTVNYFDKYINGTIIYPTALLMDYAKDFKTIESRRFHWQMITTWVSIIVAVLIALFK